MKGGNFSTSHLILGMIQDIEISKIQSTENSNYRTSSQLNELASSIKNKGLLQPIVIRTKQDCYEVVAGNRRLHACKLLGLKKILCHVVSLTDRESYEVSLIENIQRKTLTPIEEAEAFSKYVKEFGWGGVSDLASKIGKSVSYVDKRIKLLGMPKSVVESISDSSICTSIAEELIPLKDSTVQSEFARMAKENNLSTRRVRSLVSGFVSNEWLDIGNYITYDDSDNAKNRHYEGILAIDERTQRTFDKAIVTLRTAMNRIIDLTESVEDNWILHEIFMQHKNVLHSQIDLLMKEKKKI
jgi:ParB family chromosome partitioning protein